MNKFEGDAIDDIRRDIAIETLFGSPLDRGKNQAYLTMSKKEFVRVVTEQMAKDDQRFAAERNSAHRSNAPISLGLSLEQADQIKAHWERQLTVQPTRLQRLGQWLFGVRK